MVSKWSKVQLGEILSLLKDGTHNPPPRTPSGVPMLSAVHIKNGAIEITKDVPCVSLEDYALMQKKYEISSGDILLTIVGTLGRAALVKDAHGKFTVQRSVAILRPKETVVLPDYLFQLTQSSSFQKELQLSSKTTAQAGIYLGELAKVPASLPPLPKQRKIAAILTSVDDAITATKRIIDQTERVKRGLMQQLLTKGIGHTSFKQTEIGEIPTGWEVLTLGQMLEQGMIVGHQDGNHGELYPRSSEFADEGVPYLAANCIADNEIDFSLAKFLSMERALKFKKGVARNRDVLFAHNATVGPVSVLKTELDFVILSTTLTYYRCNEEIVNPYYLSQFMSSPMFVRQFTRVMGQTTRNQVPLTLQREFFHVIPPIDEQKRIKEIFTSVDSKIFVEKGNLSKLLTVKQALMQVLLTGQVRVNVYEPSEVSV